MASGQEIVDRILKSYGVEFDSSVSGKLNEFMIRYTIDILRLAKNYSIFEKKETFSLIEVRQAIKQMKENKGLSFDDMKSIMKEMPSHNITEDINNTPVYEQIFQYDERILNKPSLKVKVSEEMQKKIKDLLDNEKAIEEKERKNIGMETIIKYGIVQQDQQNPYSQVVVSKPAQEDEDDNYE